MDVRRSPKSGSPRLRRGRRRALSDKDLGRSSIERVPDYVAYQRARSFLGGFILSLFIPFVARAQFQIARLREAYILPLFYYESRQAGRQMAGGKTRRVIMKESRTIIDPMTLTAR